MRNFVALILSYLGALIFLMGCLIGFAEYSQILPLSTQILLVLPLGLVIYYLALLFNFKFAFKFSGPLFFISGFLFFIGAQLIFSDFGFYAPSFTVQWIVSFLLGLSYLIIFYYLRKNSLMVLVLIFLSYCVIKVGVWGAEHYLSLFNQQIFPVYLMLFFGVIYSFLGFVFSKTSSKTSCKNLTPILYFLGTPLFLGAIPILNQCLNSFSLIWIFIFLGSVFLTFIFSMSPGVKSKIILIWSALFLIIDSLLMTQLYFPSISWAIFFILLGIFLMLSSGLSWVLIKAINKKN